MSKHNIPITVQKESARYGFNSVEYAGRLDALIITLYAVLIAREYPSLWVFRRSYKIMEDSFRLSVAWTGLTFVPDLINRFKNTGLIIATNHP